MGYIIEVSMNVLKNSNSTEIETIINDTANLYNCDKIYMLSEEDGTIKIPRYHNVFIITFLENNYENLIKFIKYIKHYKQVYIESIYNEISYNLIYASAFYLKNINKDIGKKYKNFIQQGLFTNIEALIIKEFI